MLFVNNLIQKRQQNSDSMYSSIFMLEIIFTKSGLNSQEIVIFIPTMGPQFLKLSRNKIHIFFANSIPFWKNYDICFLAKKTNINENLSFLSKIWDFWVELVAKKDAWVSANSTHEYVNWSNNNNNNNNDNNIYIYIYIDR